MPLERGAFFCGKVRCKSSQFGSDLLTASRKIYTGIYTHSFTENIVWDFVVS